MHALITHTPTLFHPADAEALASELNAESADVREWIVVFRATCDERGFDSVGVSDAPAGVLPSESVSIGGVAWTAFPGYATREAAEKRARAMEVRNKNFGRGFGPTPIRYVGILPAAIA